MGVDELVAVLEKVDLFHDLRPRVLRRIADAGRDETLLRRETGDPVQGEEVGGFRSFSPTRRRDARRADGVCRGSRRRRAARPAGDGRLLRRALAGRRDAAVGRGAGRRRRPDTFAITKWTFAELIEDHPEVAVPMLHVMVARLRAAEAADRRADLGGPPRPG